MKSYHHSSQLLLKITLITLLISLSLSLKHNVQQMTGRTLKEQLQTKPYTLLYVCKYCQEFTPVFEKLSTNQKFNGKGLQFAKIDNSYKDELQKYGVTSYPTVLLFWKGFSDFPIHFISQRNEAELLKFLDESMDKDNSKTIKNAAQMSPYQRIQQKIVVLYGKKTAQISQKLSLALNRYRFFSWTTVNSDQQKIQIGAKQLPLNATFKEIESTIAIEFARVHDIGEESWTRMFLYKQLGIVFVNTENDKKVVKLLKQMAKDFPNVVFLNLVPEHPEYKQALRMMTVSDEENIVAVDRKADVTFVANKTYTRKSLTEFITKVQKYEWPIHRKSEKTTKEEKLTRQNFHQKMGTSQDTLLFLYRRHQKISKDFVELFNKLRKNLAENKNIQFLRCDLSSNEIQQYLEFTVEKTPKVIFYRNRMKDKPIYFSGAKLSYETVIEFIMENTTFDWEDAWGQL